VTCDLALLDAALGDRVALARMLDCDVADGWVVFLPALQRARDVLAADPRSARWGPRLFVADAPRTLVGWGGFKGPPDDDGAVEIGYAIAPAWEGRGVATAAAGALVDEAWAAPAVRAVTAHTLIGPGASVRVLEKLGFERDGNNFDGDVGLVWRFRLDRPVPSGS
jgi:RimJ/RimL family protein N-acetyltransferase